MDVTSDKSNQQMSSNQPKSLSLSGSTMASTLNTTVIQRKKKLNDREHVARLETARGRANKISLRKPKSQTREIRGGVKLSFSFRQCRNKLNPALCRFAFHVCIYIHTRMHARVRRKSQTTVILDTTCLSCRTARFATTVHMPYHAHCQSETRSS